MILKDADDRSNDLNELKRLKSVSPPGFHAAIQKQIDNLLNGIAGEREAAHFLKRAFGQSRSVAVLHDLRIGADGDYAQIDHVLIHRFQATVWVLETKNYAGRLSCDEHGDWTVWRNGKPTPIPSPVNQAHRHCITLRRWLEVNEVETIQKICPVVLISPRSSVNRKHLPPDAHIVKSDNFDVWWEKQADKIGLTTALGMLGRHLIHGMSTDDLMHLGERLTRAHVPQSYDWAAMLRLPRTTQANPSDKPSAEHGARPEGKETQDPPSAISTIYGKITITQISDGRFALRNDKNDALIELVRKACRGKAQWNPRFRNWLINASELQAVLTALEAARGSSNDNTSA